MPAPERGSLGDVGSSTEERRSRVRAARLHARRLEEMARSFFDGLIVLAATAVGFAVGHGAAWVTAAFGVLAAVLVGRALALWHLMADSDQLLEAIDSLEATVKSLE